MSSKTHLAFFVTVVSHPSFHPSSSLLSVHHVTSTAHLQINTYFSLQTFMLRCLVGNDLTALLGSLVQMYVRLYLPNPNEKWLCVSRVLFRAFGLGSGCVALVMAVERWLALTHPFVYPRVSVGIEKYILSILFILMLQSIMNQGSKKHYLIFVYPRVSDSGTL